MVSLSFEPARCCTTATVVRPAACYLCCSICGPPGRSAGSGPLVGLPGLPSFITSKESPALGLGLSYRNDAPEALTLAMIPTRTGFPCHRQGVSAASPVGPSASRCLPGSLNAAALLPVPLLAGAVPPGAASGSCVSACPVAVCLRCGLCPALWPRAGCNARVSLRVSLPSGLLPLAVGLSSDGSFQPCQGERALARPAGFALAVRCIRAVCVALWRRLSAPICRALPVSTACPFVSRALALCAALWRVFLPFRVAPPPETPFRPSCLPSGGWFGLARHNLSPACLRASCALPSLAGAGALHRLYLLHLCN